MSSFRSPGDYGIVTETVLVLEIAVPALDVTNSDTLYVPGGRPKSALKALTDPPAGAEIVAVEMSTVCPSALCTTA